MTFNSLDFAAFFVVCLLVYWQINSLAARNLSLLACSYTFYGWWDYRFLSLLTFSSFVDFYIGLALSRTDSPFRRDFLLCVSIGCNLGLLGVFKYYNFFAESAASLLTGLGLSPDLPTLHVILPVGISFYTFQTLSYTIDVYRKQIPAEADPISFFAFVSFFPQLVAGPIERASNLLPQFKVAKRFSASESVEGLRQILWGLFKKVVVADRCAPIVDEIFDHSQSYSFYFLLIGAALFAVQIYGDFSGYSDIAIGVARMMGFKLVRNFACPYFSRDIAEFWRRWHISLSTWFRDYVYFPLGGSRGTLSKSIRNVLVVFIVSGLWHGANWTFVVWGLLNAIYILPLFCLKSHRAHTDAIALGRIFPTARELFQIATTFSLVCFSWIFFRAASLADAFNYISHMTDFTLRLPGLRTCSELVVLLPVLLFLLTLEWICRDRPYPFAEAIGRRQLRWSYYLLMGVLIVASGHSKNTFIYFQF